MESKYFCNGYNKKLITNNRPKNITLNGPSAPKIIKIDSKCQKPSIKPQPAKSVNISDQRQALPVYNARQR